MPVSWRVYYADGSTAEGDDDDVLSAPAHGVVAVVQWDGGSKHILAGHDWYWYDATTRQWYGGDVHGMVDHVTRTAGVKQGRFVPNDVYDAVCVAARSDPDFECGNGREHHSTKTNRSR